MEWFIFWFLFGIASAIVASNKGRSGCGWFILGALLGPFGFIFALIVPKDTAAIELEAVSSGNIKKCTYCAELIKIEAIKCRFCGMDLPKKEPPNKEDVERKMLETEKKIFAEIPKTQNPMTESELIDLVHKHYNKREYPKCVFFINKLLREHPESIYRDFVEKRLSEITNRFLNRDV